MHVSNSTRSVKHAMSESFSISVPVLLSDDATPAQLQIAGTILETYLRGIIQDAIETDNVIQELCRMMPIKFLDAEFTQG